MKEKLTQSEKKVRKNIQAMRAKGTFKYLDKSETNQYGAWVREQVKDERITLRISGTDLEAVKNLAKSKGKKYQTFLGEVIHKLAAQA